VQAPQLQWSAEAHCRTQLHRHQDHTDLVSRLTWNFARRRGQSGGRAPPTLPVTALARAGEDA